MMRKELESRLISLSIKIDRLCNGMREGFMSQHLSRQVIRSSTSAVLNYGEAQSAESRNDFIHKVSVVLKELRETQINLKLLSASVAEDQNGQMSDCLGEVDELIAIFHKTVMTARARG